MWSKKKWHTMPPVGRNLEIIVWFSIIIRYSQNEHTRPGVFYKLKKVKVQIKSLV